MIPDKRAYFGIACILTFMLLICSGSANEISDPTIPHLFYGNVTILGNSALAGTNVSSVVSGGGGYIITTVPGQYGAQGALTPKLIVAGEIQDGEAIQFFLDGMPARCREQGAVTWTDTFPFRNGSVTNLNLNV
jgi:hypothetical protein